MEQKDEEIIMGKGMQPKQGYNQKLYDKNYDEIDWSSTRKKKNENNKTTNKKSK